MIVAFSGNIVAEEDLKKPERPLFAKLTNRPFRVGCPKPLFQKPGKVRSYFILLKILFYSHVDKTHFQNQSFALSLVLKVRVFGKRKWPIER